MKYTQGNYRILKKSAIAKEMYSFVIECPEVAAAAQPGQFVHIRVDGFTLRRPVSICGIDPEKGTLRIVFEIRGEGTAAIARLCDGDYIDRLSDIGRIDRIIAHHQSVIQSRKYQRCSNYNYSKHYYHSLVFEPFFF